MLRVLRNNSVQLEDQRQYISLAYDDARIHGLRYIESKKRELQAAAATSQDEPGEAYYEGPVVLDLNQDGILDWMQIWTLSGAGGGNHDEQYAAIFLGSPAGSYGNQPNYAGQVGSRGGKKVELDSLKRPDIELDKRELGFVLPGCKKADSDTMSECSTKGERLFIFCPRSRDHALVSVAFAEGTDQDPIRDFHGLESRLGGSFTNKTIRLTIGDQTIANSGLAPRQAYNAFEIGSVSEAGQRIGLKAGDYVVSVNGKTADTPRNLTCSVTEDFEDDLDELFGRKFVIYRPQDKKIKQLTMPDRN